MSTFPKVVLSGGKDDALRRFHPWVFSGAIHKIHGEVADGDVVEVFSSHDEYLGTGHIQNGSIAIRIFSFEQINPDHSFWKGKILDAFNYRQQIGLVDNPVTNVYRIVHGEGDGLPGLILDYYNGCIVMQAHSIGMHIIRQEIAEVLKEIYGSKLISIYDKSSETLPKQPDLDISDSYLYGKSGNTEVLENGHKFFIDWENGQKTGFFIDQRENRKLLEKYSANKNVLNTFCYTGGFSVYALKSGASEVHSVDSSKKAIELTTMNVEKNNIDSSKHKAFQSDVNDFLKDVENKYDVIILDPPAYAKHLDAKHNAIQGYKRINLQAIKQIKKGGFLFTFSCSQVIDKNLFKSTVISAAILSGRKVKIVHQLSQPADHPINAFHPEGEYLKGLVLYIE
jgi:23S rRNA (cytosine1962-C5)-methyltransferase